MLLAVGAARATTPAGLCLEPSAQYALTCYPPQEARRAERRLPVPPVDSSKAVVEFAELSLTQVATAKRVLPAPSPGVVGLEFLDGSFPPGSRGMPNPSPPTPKWTVVFKRVGRFAGQKGVVISRSREEPGGPTPTVVFGNWHLTERLPRRKLEVEIITNLDKVTLRNMGRELMREAKK